MGPTRSNGNTKVGPCSMAKDLVPDELWMFIDPLLPSEPPKPNGRLRRSLGSKASGTAAAVPRGEAGAALPSPSQPLPSISEPVSSFGSTASEPAFVILGSSDDVLLGRHLYSSVQRSTR